MRFIWDFLTALQFLTRIPIPSFSYDERAFGRSVAFFPIIGLLIAATAYGFNQIFAHHLPQPVRMILLVGVIVLITGALHEDGLADTADALGGSWTRSRALEIMRDSRIGTYGALAVTFSVLTRYVLLCRLTPQQLWPWLACAQMLARWSAVPLAAALPPARNEDSGNTGLLAKRVPLPAMLIATILLVSIGGFLLGTHFVFPLIAAFVVVVFSGLYYSRRISGTTGDCFGATIQLVEISVYLCAVMR